MIKGSNYCICGCGIAIGQNSKWARGHNANKNRDRHDWSSLEKDYNSLKSTIKVAKKYGVSHNAVVYQLRKQGILSLDHKVKLDNVMELYKEHKSVKKVAEIFGCSVSTVKERMAEEGHFFSHDNKSLDLEVGFGRYGERIALNLLEGSVDMNKKSVTYPYDIGWNDMKIDVKTSRERERPNGKTQYSFTARSKECSHYLFISLTKDDVPVELLLVPKEEVDGVSVSYTVGKVSKWHQYKLEVSENELRKAVRNAKRI